MSTSISLPSGASLRVSFVVTALRFDHSSQRCHRVCSAVDIAKAVACLDDPLAIQLLHAGVKQGARTLRVLSGLDGGRQVGVSVRVLGARSAWRPDVVGGAHVKPGGRGVRTAPATQTGTAIPRSSRPVLERRVRQYAGGASHSRSTHSSAADRPAAGRLIQPAKATNLRRVRGEGTGPGGARSEKGPYVAFRAG